MGLILNRNSLGYLERVHGEICSIAVAAPGRSRGPGQFLGSLGQGEDIVEKGCDLGEVGGASRDVIHEEVSHSPLVVPGHELGRLARSSY